MCFSYYIIYNILEINKYIFLTIINLKNNTFVVYPSKIPKHWNWNSINQLYFNTYTKSYHVNCTYIHLFEYWEKNVNN